MKKKCELCGELARMHCESDQASLCWDCDVKVHGANFLVAKHSRTLLCHVCFNPTPWLASGHHLSPAVSVCESCVSSSAAATDRSSHDAELTATPPEEESSEEDEYEEVDEDYDDEDEEEEVEDGENQVVPFSADSTSFSMSKPVASSDSLSSSGGGFGLKRRREESHSFYSDDEIGCSSSHVGSGRDQDHGEAASSSINSSSRLLKQPRLLCEVNQPRSGRDQDHGEAESRSTAIISSLKRLEKHMITNDGDASAAIIGICRLSRDQSR